MARPTEALAIVPRITGHLCHVLNAVPLPAKPLHRGVILEHDFRLRMKYTCCETGFDVHFPMTNEHDAHRQTCLDAVLDGDHWLHTPALPPADNSGWLLAEQDVGLEDGMDVGDLYDAEGDTRRRGADPLFPCEHGRLGRFLAHRKRLLSLQQVSQATSTLIILRARGFWLSLSRPRVQLSTDVRGVLVRLRT